MIITPKALDVLTIWVQNMSVRISMKHFSALLAMFVILILELVTSAKSLVLAMLIKPNARIIVFLLLMCTNATPLTILAKSVKIKLIRLAHPKAMPVIIVKNQRSCLNV